VPHQLLTSFAPPWLLAYYARAASDDAALATQPGVTATLIRTSGLRSATYIMLRCKCCPHCGAASERVDGCRFVECGACVREWCYACGSPDPDACICVRKYHVRRDLEELIAGFHERLGPPHGRGVLVSLFKAAALFVGFPFYVVLNALWVVPYVAVSLSTADAIATAVDAGAPQPADVLACLPHMLVAARQAATTCRCLCAAPGADTYIDGDDIEGGDIVGVQEWRQPGSLMCRLAAACLTLTFCLTVVPLVMTLWLAAAPVRYVGAVLGDASGESDGQPTAPAEV
jgi:hypothetical protein